jgi:peroxiredoxin
MIKKYFLYIIVLLIPFLGSIANAQYKPKPGGEIGTKAAEFSLINLVGEEVTSEQFEGKVVILNFWATWCGPCRFEIPDFIKIYKKYQKDGLEIVGIAVSSGSAVQIQKFVDKWGINYPVLTGDEKYLQDLANKYGGIFGIPTTFLIDRKGVIREKWIGARTEKVFLAAIEKCL